MTRMIIRAVPTRVEFVRYLKRHLPNAEWCFDKTHNAMETFLRSLDMAGDDPCVLMEEDILLTEGFVDKLEAEIARHPKTVIQFFSMRSADLTVGSRHDRNYIANLCFYLPATYARMIVEFEPQWKDKGKHLGGTDLLVSDFLKSRREPYWIHVPSLVEHRISRSAIDRRRSSKRQSKTFANPID